MMDSFGSSSGSNAEACAMKVPPSGKPPQQPLSIEVDRDEHWPLSGKPFFHVILANSHITTKYLTLPTTIRSALSSDYIPMTLAYRGKFWHMVCSGNKNYKRLQNGWYEFVSDNKLKVGDVLVFELVEQRSDEIKFKVQVLSSHLPPELKYKVNGHTKYYPIHLD